MATIERSYPDIPWFSFPQVAGRKALLVQATVIALLTVLIFVNALQVPRTVMGIGLDSSAVYIIDKMACGPLMFGTDIIYTYGPFGFLLFGAENVGHHWQIAFGFWFVLYGLFSVALAYLVTSTCSGWRLLVAMALAAFVVRWVTSPCLPFFFVSTLR